MLTAIMTILLISERGVFAHTQEYNSLPACEAAKTIILRDTKTYKFTDIHIHCTPTDLPTPQTYRHTSPGNRGENQ